MSSSKQMKTILKWALIICLIFLIIISISNMMSSQDNNSQSEYDFNLSHDDGDVIDESYDNNYENDSHIESDEDYHGVDDSPYAIAKNDPDWYYDHYDYGDYDDIDEYLESQGY